jgi:hypothetical protein
MKNLLAILAVALFSVTMSAQEQKPKEKAVKACCSADMKASADGSKVSATDKKSCSSDLKAANVEAKLESNPAIAAEPVKACSTEAKKSCCSAKKA